MKPLKRLSEIHNQLPILQWALPFFAGIITSKWLMLQAWHNADSSLAITVISLICIAILLVFKRLRNRKTIYVFVFLGALIYGFIRLPPTKTYDPLHYPPREATLEIQVDHLINSPQVDETGFIQLRGTVLTSNIPTPNIAQSRIYAVAYKPEDLEAPLAESIVIIRGSLYFHNTYTDPFELLLRQATVIEVDSRSAHLINRLQQSILSKIDTTLTLGEPANQPYANHLKAILTGNKSYLSFEDKERMRQLGIMHFLAISGFHLSIIALIFYQCAQITRIPRAWIPVVTFIGCALFVWVTGASVSAQRALWMLGFYFGAYYLERKPNILSSVLASALAIVVVEPSQLFTPGFKLSYTIVLTLIIYGLPLQRTLNYRLNKRQLLPDQWSHWSIRALRQFRKWAIVSVCISWAAYWASLPIVVGYFSLIPFFAILINPLIAPLIGLSLTCGLISMAFGFVGLSSVAYFINHASWVLLDLVNKISQMGTSIVINHTTIELPTDTANLGIFFILIILAAIAYDKPARKLHLFLYLPAVSLLSVLITTLLA